MINDGKDLTYEQAVAKGYSIQGEHIEFYDVDQQIYIEGPILQGDLYNITAQLLQNGSVVNSFTYTVKCTSPV